MKATSLLIICAFTLVPLATAQTVHHVSGRTPVLGMGRELSAERPATGIAPKPASRVSLAANRWKLLATLPGAVIHDISFPNRHVGYAAAELGQVWKTTDGGATWKEIVNLNFPYYWYGVHALTTNDVVIAGFNDQTFEGIIR